MAFFFYHLNTPRADFAQPMTAEKQVLMDRHAAYLREALDRGEVLAFGPVADPAGFWGMGLVEVDGPEAARALADGDPLILAQAGFSYDILPMPNAVVRGGAGPSA